ncbi:MAG: Rrf2 family transcriptional regulator [Limisphaerales bacterium]
MHISRAGEYGVLGLLHLVKQPNGQPVMIDAVSRDVAIPKSFLAKIFQDLAKAGILRSQRGARGGFSLARAADQITILQIIEAIDGKIALQRCLSEVPDCERRESCALCSLFEQAQDRLKEVFSRTTLLELAEKQEVVGPLVPVAANPASRASTPETPKTPESATISRRLALDDENVLDQPVPAGP